VKKFCFLLLFLTTIAVAEEDPFSMLDVSDNAVGGDDTRIADNSDFNSDTQPDADSSRKVSGDPDYRVIDFFRRRRPESELKVPEPEDGERLFWKIGNSMRDVDIPSGDYSVIRVKDCDVGYFIRYVGNVHSDGKHATVTQTSNEIHSGDLIVKEEFRPIRLPSLNSGGGFAGKNDESFGRVLALNEPGQDDEMLFSGDRNLIAAKFKDYKGGSSTTVGASFVIRRKGEEIAKAVVVDTDLDLATLYVFNIIREVKNEDELFAQ
jgi:hypothetical protein